MTSVCTDVPRLSADPYAVESTAALVGQWFVLHTRSRQEKALARSLDAMNCEYFLPLVSSTRFHGKRKAMVEMPLFPNYLFLFGSREDAFEADRTGRVAQIIDIADQQRFEHEIEGIRRAVTSGMSLDPYPYLRRGVAVEVRSGPLRGVRGLVESRLRVDRLVLQVDVLGQACSLEIDGALLDPIN
jgi:transcription antitermination factor NusG